MMGEIEVWEHHRLLVATQKGGDKMDKIFNHLYRIKQQYKEGLIDKTDALAALTNALIPVVLANAAEKSKIVAEVSRETRTLDKIRQIVR